MALGAACAPWAILQAADGNVAIDNLVLAHGATTYRIPHLELTGAALSAAELSTLFSGDEKAIDARLARLSAKRLFIPSMTSERRTGDAVERNSYRNLTAEDIVAGRIAVARAAGSEQTIERPDRSEHYLWGASVSKGIDLRQLVHMALAVRSDPQEALKPLIEEESVESLAMEGKGEKLKVTTGPIKVTGVKGRALATAPATLLERLEKFDPDKGQADPALLKDFIDALAALDVASIEARDIAATGAGAPADKPYTVRIGRVSAARLAGAGIGEFALENLSLVSSDGGKASLARFGLRDAQLASLIDNAYPRLAHIEAKGLYADLPDVRMDGASRMKFSLDGFEGDFSDFREIAPTKFAMRMDRMKIDLAARGEAPSTAQFLALGYRSLDLSAALAGEWSEKTKEATFAPLRFEGKDMGAATLNVTFGNVSDAVFSSMPLVSKAAALAASLKAIDLTLEGGGLVDRLLVQAAREQKTSVEKARSDYARSVSTVMNDLCGGGEKSKRISSAFSAYIMKPKRLHVRLATERGVNALDALGKKPAEILESVEVEATAER